jgi:hypothetical protein
MDLPNQARGDDEANQDQVCTLHALANEDQVDLNEDE